MHNTKAVESDARAQWNRDTKLRAEFGDNFETYLAYRQAHARGRIKVLSDPGLKRFKKEDFRNGNV